MLKWIHESERIFRPPSGISSRTRKRVPNRLISIKNLIQSFIKSYELCSNKKLIMISKKHNFNLTVN